VDVGVQCTELASVVADKEKEKLTDAVTAYEMQGRNSPNSLQEAGFRFLCYQLAYLLFSRIFLMASKNC
jgi:hypothetical protein